MADIFMHYQLAKDTYETLLPEQKKHVNQATFITGSQGPDPFFYRILSKKRIQTMQIGEHLHDHHINDAIKAMLIHVKQHPSKENIGFLLGYVLHFALDVHIHPYVYHHVGVYDKHDPKTAHMRGLHLKFERRIDAALIKKTYNINPAAFRLKKRALPLKKVPQDIITTINHVTKTVYDIDEGGRLYQKGYRGMRRVLKLAIQDKYGLKKRLYSFIDRFPNKRDLFFKDLSFYQPDLSFDYLNEQAALWHHPVNRASSHDSVETLYQKAFDMSKRFIHRLLDDVLNDQPFDVEASFNNLSYNTGLDCEDTRPMQYFNLFTTSKS